MLGIHSKLQWSGKLYHLETYQDFLDYTYTSCDVGYDEQGTESAAGENRLVLSTKLVSTPRYVLGITFHYPENQDTRYSFDPGDAEYRNVGR